MQDGKKIRKRSESRWIIFYLHPSMKETSFIAQNKKKWARFEKLAANKSNDPDEVSELFTEITEDLSYARTFYPRRSVRVYLNQLSQGVFTSLYKQRKQPLGNFMKFWTETVPLEMYRARYNLLTAFLFFVLAVIIGAVSQQYDGKFVNLILGDGYVWMTERNIEDGNPMGVYGSSPQGSMFLMITINNIRVAFFTFTMGIFWTLGTYFLLLYNGVMLGAFQWWFKAKGLLLTSFLAVWIHGAFEISSIIIAGAAGITVGSGLIFPKSYSRVQSLIFSAKRGLIIMLSLIPFFIIAGFLESYVTRHYLSIPDLVKLGIILASFGIIIAYYVIYPQIVARRFPEKIPLKEVPRYIPERQLEWFKIRKVSEIFTDSFYLFIEKIGKISRIFFSVIFPLILVLIGVIYSIDYYKFDFRFEYFHWYDNFGRLFGTPNHFEWYKFLGWSLLLSLFIASVFFVIHDKESDGLYKRFFKFLAQHWLWLGVFSVMVFSILVLSPGLLLFVLIFAMPVVMLIPPIITIEKQNFFSAFGSAFKLGKGVYGDGLGTFLVFFIITVIFFMFLANPMGYGLLDFIDNIVKEITITLTDRYSVVISAINSVFYVLFIFLIMSLYLFSFAFTYYSSEEKKTAKGLYDRLEKFGKRNKNVETDLDFE